MRWKSNEKLTESVGKSMNRSRNVLIISYKKVFDCFYSIEKVIKL